MSYLGELYFSQDLYKKLIEILKFSKVIFLVILLSLMIRFLFIAAKKRKLKFCMVCKIGFCISQLWNLQFFENSIYKEYTPVFFQGEKFLYHMNRIHASGLFLTFCFYAFFITYFLINKILEIKEKFKS